jgi:hypothetical protein
LAQKCCQLDIYLSLKVDQYLKPTKKMIITIFIVKAVKIHNIFKTRIYKINIYYNKTNVLQITNVSQISPKKTIEDKILGWVIFKDIITCRCKTRDKHSPRNRQNFMYKKSKVNQTIINNLKYLRIKAIKMIILAIIIHKTCLKINFFSK